MNHRSVTRVVAVTSLTCLLSVFALPAAAAPFGAATVEGLWSPIQWIEAIWTGWFGGGEDAADSSGARNVHANLGNALDPDGDESYQTGTDPDGGELSEPSGGSGTP